MLKIFTGLYRRDIFQLWQERRKDRRCKKYLRRLSRYKELLQNEQMDATGDIFWNDVVGTLAPSEDIQQERISLLVSRIRVFRSILWEALEWDRGSDAHSDWVKIRNAMQNALSWPDYGLDIEYEDKIHS